MGIEIKTVRNNSDKKKFIKSQWNFYEGDPNFVPPIIFDRMKLLNTEKNPFYKHSEIELFYAERDGKIVGRIAAITNDNHNKTHNDKLGFFGFFECANDLEVAGMLFDRAAEWLKSKGMDAMRGPVNPSMNDETGLLVDGFDSPPLVLMTYNPKYYIDLIENSGFEIAKNLFAYELHTEKYMTEKLKRMQDIVRKRHKITIRDMKFKDKKQFKKDVETLKKIYNSAWEPNWGFVKMTDEEFDFLANDLKQFAWEDFVMIAEIDGQPAGFAMTMPDLNIPLRHNKNGTLAGAIWHLLTKKKKIDAVRIIVLGVMKQYQKTGVDAVIYYECGLRARRHNIVRAEASWILEDNEMMNKGLTMTMNGKHYKTYRLYQKNI